MDISLFEKTTYNQVERKEIGTVRAIVSALYGETGVITPFGKKTVTDHSKKFTIRAFSPNNPNESTSIVCSRVVSDKLRAREITLTQLLDFTVVEHTVGADYDNAGLVYPTIVMPSAVATDMPTVSIANKAQEAYSAEVNDSIEELLAFM